MPISPAQLEAYFCEKYDLENICEKIDKKMKDLAPSDVDSVTVHVDMLPEFIVDKIKAIYVEAGWAWVSHKRYDDQRESSSIFTFNRYAKSCD